MDEGWYLMSVGDLEIELARLRGEDRRPSGALSLSVEDALAYRDSGNLPDDRGRSLRLFLRPDAAAGISLDERRLAFEPDFLESPNWRRQGSRPVNVVPLGSMQRSPGAWWEDPDMAALESEWSDTGEIDGVRIPGEYRSFVYKTIVLLRRTETQITVQSIADAIARWLDPDQVAEIRGALEAANDHPSDG